MRTGGWRAGAASPPAGPQPPHEATKLADPYPISGQSRETLPTRSIMTSADNGAVIWDVDGTLVDTAELHFQAWAELCRELGRPFTRADFAATFGRRNPEIFQYLFGDRFGAAEVDELGFRKEEFYRAAA